MSELKLNDENDRYHEKDNRVWRLHKLITTKEIEQWMIMKLWKSWKSSQVWKSWMNEQDS
jgi:hypothetical protein